MDGVKVKEEPAPNSSTKKRKRIKREEDDGASHQDSESDDGGVIGSAAAIHKSSPVPGRLILKPPKKVSKAEQAAQELTHQREAKCDVEIAHLIRVTDRRRKRARYLEGSIKRTWKRIRTRDPFEYSEDEQTILNAEMMASAASSHKRKNIDLSTLNSHIMSSLSGVRDSNLGNDFGEEANSLVTTFRRANRRLVRWYGLEELQKTIKSVKAKSEEKPAEKDKKTKKSMPPRHIDEAEANGKQGLEETLKTEDME